MSLERDVEALKIQVQRLSDELIMYRSTREPFSRPPDQLRWAVACDPNAPEPTEEEEEPEAPPYPTGESNTFPIRFLDVAVDGEEGLQEADFDERATNAQAYAHNVRGSWVPKGVPILVMEHDGRSANDLPEEGDPDKTLWFFVDAPKFYYGKLTGTLEKGEFAGVKIWLPGEEADLYVEGDEWWETDCTLQAQDRFLIADGETVETGTWVEIAWYFSRWVIRQAACGPEEVED